MHAPRQQRERKRRRVLSVALGGAAAAPVALCACGSARLSERQDLQRLAVTGDEPPERPARTRTGTRFKFDLAEAEGSGA